MSSTISRRLAPVRLGILTLGVLMVLIAASVSAPAVVPAHAPDEVKAAGNRSVRGEYQAGFADAVALLIGHAPGSCPDCAATVDPARTSRAIRTAYGLMQTDATLYSRAKRQPASSSASVNCCCSNE